MSWLTKKHAEWLQRWSIPRGEIEIDNRFRQIELAASLMAYSLLSGESLEPVDKEIKSIINKTKCKYGRPYHVLSNVRALLDRALSFPFVWALIGWGMWPQGVAP